MTKQPVWKCIANLGDASPLEHGGYFVYMDTTGVYGPEATLLEPNDESWDIMNRCHDCDGIDAPCAKHTDLPCAMEYRFTLDRCTWIDGILSDNHFHPNHSAWFATPEDDKDSRPQDNTYLSGIAETMDIDLDELRAMFCSDNPCTLAEAYKLVADYHGADNLDSYPLTWTVGQYAELKARFRQGASHG